MGSAPPGAAGGAGKRPHRRVTALAQVAGALAILVAVELVFLWSSGVELADFDFGRGTVRCGVAGLGTSCGSVAP